ncbi:hypothetical protein C8R43DRAFT_1242165 [Mycena crocata]|nr:hypothetical protein C8R43DRAFT_1242165 [Mycena crocata]
MPASERQSSGSLSSSFDEAINALLLARGSASERVAELSAECETLKKEADRLRSDRSAIQNWLGQERQSRQLDWNGFGTERMRFERRERDLLAEREEMKKQRDTKAMQLAQSLKAIQNAVGLDDTVTRLRSDRDLATQLSQAVRLIQQKEDRVTEGLHAQSLIARERDSLAAQLSKVMSEAARERDSLTTQYSRAMQIIMQKNEQITARLRAEADLVREKDSLAAQLSQVIHQKDEQKRAERDISREQDSPEGTIAANRELEVTHVKTEQLSRDDGAVSNTRKRSRSEQDVSEVNFEVEPREKLRKLSPPSGSAVRMPPTGRQVEVVITRSPRVRPPSKIYPTRSSRSALIRVDQNKVGDAHRPGHVLVAH